MGISQQSVPTIKCRPCQNVELTLESPDSRPRSQTPDPRTFQSYQKAATTQQTVANGIRGEVAESPDPDPEPRTLQAYEKAATTQTVSDE